MKKLQLFVAFWRNFFIGDNPLIAYMTMWSLAFVFSMSHYSMPLWPLLPVCVSFIIVASPHLKHPATTKFNNFLILLSCMVSIVIIPLILFRLVSSDLTPLNISRILLTFLPVLIAAGALTPLYKRFPVFTHIIAMFTSIYLVYNIPW